MSASSIKAAIATILGTVTALQHVDLHYPRFSEQIFPNDYPRAVIWRKSAQEVRTAAGGSGPIGYKMIRWQMCIHVFALFQDPLTEATVGWDNLLDSIITALRAASGPSSWASGAGDVTDVSKIMRAEEIEEQDLQPSMGEAEHAYNSYLILTVEEWVKA